MSPKKQSPEQDANHRPDARRGDEACSGSSGCGCRPELGRRTFIALGSSAAAAFLAPGGVGRAPLARGEENPYLRLIPADKELDPDWLSSLFARGEPTVYDGAALDLIGMPVGGLCSGMVYLSGDGRLWRWDVFNELQEGVEAKAIEYRGATVRARDGSNYVLPPAASSPFEIGFGIAVEAGGESRSRRLDRTGFREVSFHGEYPIGTVRYRDDACPVSVRLEAFSPFVPLDVDESSLPATVMSYTVRNDSAREVKVTLEGRLENAVCITSKATVSGVRKNRIRRGGDWTALVCSAEPEPEPLAPTRPDVVFDDFERADHGEWVAEGTAFGTGPIRMKDMPAYQGEIGGAGERVVNSHNVRQGEDVRGGDGHTGTLTSPAFEITRRFIHFLIGGGNHADKTCLQLLVDGDVVRTAPGHNHNHLRPDSFAVSDLQGRQARLRIVDAVAGAWGNIGVDRIVLSDRARTNVRLERQRDFGTMALAAVGTAAIGAANAAGGGESEATSSMATKLVGSVSSTVTIAPGAEATVPFVVAWHFPLLTLPRLGEVGRHYAARFGSALEVVRHVAERLDPLARATRLWRDTWYDSTLPWWFLDRTMANTSTLATTTCYRAKDGRFWAWEGIGCCPGTCTHVWHYAQAPGRLFPALERDERERVDYGIAFDARTGVIAYRGEWHSHPAHDGQAGTILRTYREHQMSADDAFLRRNWAKIRRSVEFLIERDGNDDGMIEGAQPNTLDAAWYGKISFLASLYLAALRAGEAMATEVGDTEFARRCSSIAGRGAQAILQLYNGEYFFQEEDPKHPNEIGVGAGCYIDQVFGQSWAFQVGLGRVFDADATRSALRSLWKYNFVPDIGPFREHFRRGRWYVVPGEAGLVMSSWPRGGKRTGWEKHWQYMYFNECMTGFEWQVAAHMLWEGLVTEGLAVGRAIHDRYHASKRNPYNEVECSDHYARAMASYGAFLAACGYEYHGPKGHLAFSPRLSPESFKAAFTAAEGWGSFEQRVVGAELRASIGLRYGSLRLRRLTLELPDSAAITRASRVIVGGEPAEFDQQGRRVSIRLSDLEPLTAGVSLEITIA